MANGWIVGGVGPALLGLAAFGSCGHASGQGGAPGSVIHGRVATDDGTVYEGALRFGGDEEVAWGNYFNGVKDDNPWAIRVPPEQLRENVPVALFGVPIARLEREIDLDRPFMARFGDIARIDAPGRELRVTLKTGTVFELDRFSADDFADGACPTRSTVAVARAMKRARGLKPGEARRYVRDVSSRALEAIGSIEDAELIGRILEHRAQRREDDLRGTPFVPCAPPQPALL